MRISDWSSDVCSSDLFLYQLVTPSAPHARARLARSIFPTKASVAASVGSMSFSRFTTRVRMHSNIYSMLHSTMKIALPFTATAELGPPQMKKLGKPGTVRSEEHTSEIQSLMRISYAV